MNVDLCDVCGQNMKGTEPYRARIKKRICSWTETWWSGLDVCEPCWEDFKGFVEARTSNPTATTETPEEEG